MTSEVFDYLVVCLLSIIEFMHLNCLMCFKFITVSMVIDVQIVPPLTFIGCSYKVFIGWFLSPLT